MIAVCQNQGPGDGVAVTLDNMKSMLSRDRGEKDLTSSQCVFAQAYRQLSETDPKVLRTVWDGERVFQVREVAIYQVVMHNFRVDWRSGVAPSCSTFRTYGVRRA